jgi:hypothetical protein
MSVMLFVIAVKDTYIATAVPELHTDCKIIWCKLELIGHKAVYLSCYYNPKANNEASIQEFGTSMERAPRIVNTFIIGAGDFNLPGWNWKENSLKPNTQYPGIHHLFTDILDDHGLCQIVEEPTRGSNILDLIVTNYPASFRRTEIIPGVSDHDIVFTEVNILPVKHYQKPRTIPLYREAKWNNVKQDLHNIHQCITKMDEQNQSVESMWNIFQTKLQESIQKNIPQKKARQKDGCL